MAESDAKSETAVTEVDLRLWQLANGKFKLVTLADIAEAVDIGLVCWAPLPALVNSASDDTNSGQQTWLPSASGWGDWQHRQLERLLHRLALDKIWCTLLLPCGRLPAEDMKLEMCPEDRERQLDLSWAIHAAGFQQTERESGSRPATVVGLTVCTSWCLWDPRELRALSDTLALSDKPHELDRQCLDALTRRRTYHLLTTAGDAEPQEMELVALHPTLATKLVAISLFAKLSKIWSATFAFHGDDLLLWVPSGKTEVAGAADIHYSMLKLDRGTFSGFQGFQFK